MKKVFVITNNLLGLWFHAAKAAQKGACEWEIASIAITHDTYKLLFKEDLERIKPYKWVSLDNQLDQAREKIRVHYPKFISDLPKRTIGPHGSLFQLFQDGVINLWWYLAFTDKSPLCTRLVNHLYYAHAVIEVLRANHFDELWCDIDDPWLVATIIRNAPPHIHIRKTIPFFHPREFFRRCLARLKESGCFRFLAVLLRAILENLFLLITLRHTRLAQVSRDKLEKCILFYSRYPAWWKGALDGDDCDGFFLTLPERLKSNWPYCFAVWLTMDIWSIWRFRKRIRRAFLRHHLFPLSGLLRVRDIVALASPRYLTMIAKFQFKIAGSLDICFLGMNITPLIVGEVLRSFGNREFFLCFLIQRAFERLTQEHSVQTVVYRAEFQPFEKAILYGVRQRVPTIGHQHSTVGCYHLNNVLCPDDLNVQWSKSSSADSMPVPDIVTTTGNYGARLYREAGYGEDMVETCGPIRFPHLLVSEQSSSIQHLRSRKMKIIFVPTTVVLSEVYNLLSLISDAVDESMRDKLTFLFKCHPIARFEKKISAFLSKASSRFQYEFVDSHALLYDFLRSSDALLNSGNTLSAEALALNILAIIFDDNSHFSYNPLAVAPEAVLTVKNPDDLRRVLNAVISDDLEIKSVQKAWPEAVRLMFHSLEEDPYEKFIGLLDRKIGKRQFTNERLPMVECS